MHLPKTMVIFALALSIAGGGAYAGSWNAIDEPVSQEAAISGDPDKPRRHFRVRDPARLDPAAADRIYRDMARDLADIYGLSGDAAAGVYQKWRRYNTSPYLSVTHGQRYVNNYANALARDYGRFEQSGPFPLGAIIAKDSVAVTKAGGIFAGPLFLMEKMNAGFNADSGNWRYTMILPNGSVFGTTGGAGGAKVQFCVECHISVAPEVDSMFFMPEEYRAK